MRLGLTILIAGMCAQTPASPRAARVQHEASRQAEAFDAIAAHDREWLIRLMLRGDDLEVTNALGETVLHAAITLGDVSLISPLVGENASLGARNRDGDSALRRLLAMQPEDSVVRSVAERSGVDERGRSALHIAVLDHRYEWMEMLLNFGCNISARDRDDVSVLELVQGDPEVLRRVLELPLADYVRDAVQSNDREEVRAWRAFPVSADVLAAAFDLIPSTEMVRTLFELGVDPKSESAHCRLSDAVQNRETDMIEILLTYGVATEAPLKWAHSVGVLEVCMGCPNCPDSHDWAWVYRSCTTPLEMAVEDPALVARLLRAGAKVEVTPDDAPALTAAVRQGALESVRLLAAEGGLGVKSAGRTPLHDAVRRGQYDMVAELLRAGAPVDSRSEADRGATPLRLAIDSGDAEMIRLLSAYGQTEFIGPLPSRLQEAKEHTGWLAEAGLRSDLRAFEVHGRLVVLAKDGAVSAVKTLDELDGIVTEVRSQVGATRLLAVADALARSPVAGFLTYERYSPFRRSTNLTEWESCARLTSACAREETQVADGWSIERTLYVSQKNRDRHARGVQALVRWSGRVEYTITVLDEALYQCR